MANPWLTAAAPDQTPRQLSGKLPSFIPNVDSLWILARSANYHWVIYSPASGRAYAVVFK